MDLSELDLDWQNIGEWPLVIKLIAMLVVAAAIVAGSYYFVIKEQYQELAKVEGEEQKLKKEFEKKQAKAANLDAYKKQLKDMEKSFGVMLKQLPDKTEVAALLVDVSQTGLAAGLEFELFQPRGEIKKGFYAELPIRLRVIGTYHEFGEFVSGLAALPRIVTVHDVKIYPMDKERGRRDNLKPSGQLIMEATAKTYRYLEEAG